MAVRSPVPGKWGRTRWDVFAEAIEGGWVKTARLAVLLVVYGAPPCGAAVYALHLVVAYLHHR
jgi:hypothetical protein